MEKAAFKYLIEEVRDGFMVPAHVKQAWAADLSVLEEIDRICCKHNIAYFADWGTLLGAVRHGGIIPWDDDIDIVMKREDYNRFLEASEQEFRTGFKVLTYRNQAPANWLFMGKVVNCDHICFEADHMRSFYNYPFISSVDIFVLDYIYDDPKQEKRRCDLCLYMLGVANAITAGTLKGVQIQNNLEHIRKTWGLELQYKADPIEMGRYLYGKIEEQFSVVRPETAKQLCQLFPWGLKGNARTYPKEYYEKAIRLPFENTTMPVPVAFDDMLRARYGDYLKIFRNGGAHEYPNYEYQKRNFMDSTGAKLPKYVFAEGEIRAERICPDEGEEELSFKDMLRYGSAELGVPSDAEQIVTMQQLAIDLGNLIEEVKGQGQESVTYLEKYCELLYGLYELLQRDETEATDNFRQELDSCMSKLETCVKQFKDVLQRTILDKKLITCLVVYDFERAVIEPIMKNLLQQWENVEVQLVVLNYYKKDFDGSLLESRNDFEAWRTLKTECEKNISVLTQEKMPPERLQFLYPDQILFTNGYDKWNENISLHPAFFSENLVKCTGELIYVSPYQIEPFTRENEKAYINLQYYVLCPGVVRADKIVVSDERIRERYIEKLTEFSGSDYEKHWENAVVNISQWMNTETQSNTKREDSVSDNRRKQLLYCISLGALLEKGALAIEKIERNLEFLKNSREIEVHVCTFPELTEDVRNLNFGLFLQLTDLFTACGIKQEKLEDMLPGAIDAYYGDGSPFVTKMVGVRKPVMVQNYEV